MGAMGAIAPTAKKSWGDAPNRTHGNFVISSILKQ